MQIDEAHVQGNFPLSFELSQAAHDEKRVNLLIVPDESRAIPQGVPPSLALIVKEKREDFQQRFAFMGNKRIISIRANLFSVMNLDDRASCPCWGTSSRSPNHVKDAVSKIYPPFRSESSLSFVRSASCAGREHCWESRTNTTQIEIYSYEFWEF